MLICAARVRSTLLRAPFAAHFITMNCPKPWAIDAASIVTLHDACNKEMYVLWQAIAVLVDFGLALEKNDVGKALVNMTMQPKPSFTPKSRVRNEPSKARPSREFRYGDGPRR